MMVMTINNSMSVKPPGEPRAEDREPRADGRAPSAERHTQPFGPGIRSAERRVLTADGWRRLD
jgi:hypothetical protein